MWQGQNGDEETGERNGNRVGAHIVTPFVT